VECIRVHFSGSGSGSGSGSAAAAAGVAAGTGTGGVAARHRSSGSSGSGSGYGSGSGSGSGGSGSGGIDSGAASSRAEGSRPRRVTASNRMLVYQATEKDCVGEEGEAQECVICFEEFEEGDEMGRLLCLCKFHRVSFPPSFFSLCLFGALVGVRVGVGVRGWVKRIGSRDAVKGVDWTKLTWIRTELYPQVVGD